MTGSIDLHMHSCYSEDGEYTPAELVGMCKDAGIRLMALTDHNCVKGVEQALEEAERKNIRCYTGIEIDCVHQGISFHVLGYNIDYQSPDFEEIEQNVRKQGLQASKERLRLISKLGFDLNEQEVAAAAADSFWPEQWTAEVIVEILLGKQEYLDNELLRSFRAGGEHSDNPYVDFYWGYCAQGKPCYAEITFPEMREIIDIIHKNGGDAVLAHPGNNLNGRFEMIEELIPLGLDGIEAYSNYHDKETNRWFAQKAKEHGLLATRGSDFHGKTKPQVRLGYCGC